MIYITGDTHGMIDWEKINTTRFLDQYYLTREDNLIILGDFGGVWDGAEQDRYIIKTYEKRSFTTLFIDGNHENHDLLDAYPVEEWNGGKVHFISEHVIHLMRGQVYEIDGLKMFTMGGAESIDKAYRREGMSWWSREMPSDEEYDEAIRNLEKHDFDVDVVLTHCAPEGYLGKALCYRAENRLTRFLEDLITEHGLVFKHWYIGHYHRDLEWDKFSLMYSKIRKLE